MTADSIREFFGLPLMTEEEHKELNASLTAWVNDHSPMMYIPPPGCKVERCGTDSESNSNISTVDELRAAEKTAGVRGAKMERSRIISRLREYMNIIKANGQIGAAACLLAVIRELEGS